MWYTMTFYYFLDTSDSNLLPNLKVILSTYSPAWVGYMSQGGNPAWLHDLTIKLTSRKLSTYLTFITHSSLQIILTNHIFRNLLIFFIYLYYRNHDKGRNLLILIESSGYENALYSLFLFSSINWKNDTKLHQRHL